MELDWQGNDVLVIPVPVVMMVVIVILLLGMSTGVTDANSATGEVPYEAITLPASFF